MNLDKDKIQNELPPVILTIYTSQGGGFCVQNDFAKSEIQIIFGW